MAFRIGLPVDREARNAECGHHCARALAAWTVYKAFCATP